MGIGVKATSQDSRWDRAGVAITAKSANARNIMARPGCGENTTRSGRYKKKGDSESSSARFEVGGERPLLLVFAGQSVNEDIFSTQYAVRSTVRSY